MAEEFIELVSRHVRFYAESGMRISDSDRQPRLIVTISEEEYWEFYEKDVAALQSGDPPRFHLTVRIPEGKEIALPKGPADVVLFLKRWNVKGHTGVSAHLHSIIPSTTPREA